MQAAIAGATTGGDRIACGGWDGRSDGYADDTISHSSLGVDREGGDGDLREDLAAQGWSLARSPHHATAMRWIGGLLFKVSTMRFFGLTCWRK